METDIDELSTHMSTLSTNSIDIPIFDNHCPLSTLILPSMSSCPMASDDYNHLLIYHHQTLLLVDLPTFQILFSISILPFIECTISDICFYSPLNCFLLSSSNTIYSLASNQQLSLVQTFSNTIWSITQTSHHLFICYLFGSSIEQWKFHSTERLLINRWFKEDFLESFDMGINCIRTNDQYLGMTIKEKNFSWRIDLFELETMNRIHRGQTIQQENNLSNWIGLLYPLDTYRWLFADGDQGLFLIDQQELQQKQLMHVACNFCLIRNENTRKYSSIVIQSYDALHLYNL